MILKKIAHNVAQAFRLAQAADKKLSTGIAAALDAKAEQLREYEKSFEPEPPKPDPLLEARTSLAQAGFSAAAATYALRRFAEALKPEPLSHLTNNWRKMHGLPMHRKPAAFRRRRQDLAARPKRNRRHPADADEEKHPKRASGMEPGKMSDLRTGMLETNVKTGAPAEENASSLHRVRTQNRK